MLVLSRRVGESVVIGDGIIVTVVRVDGESVRLGIAAPANIPVHRQEVFEEIQKNNREALTRLRQRLPKLAPQQGSEKNIEKAPVTAPA